jgi:hypothetical protein
MVVYHSEFGKIWFDILLGEFAEKYKKNFNSIKRENFNSYMIDNRQGVLLPDGRTFDCVIYSCKNNNSICKQAFEFLLQEKNYCISIRNKHYGDVDISEFYSLLNSLKTDEKLLFNDYLQNDKFFNTNRFNETIRKLSFEYYKNIFWDYFSCQKTPENHFFCCHVFPVIECISILSNSPAGLYYGMVDEINSDGTTGIRHFDCRDISFWQLPINRPNLWDNSGNTGTLIYLDSSCAKDNLEKLLNETANNITTEDEFGECLNNIEFFGGWLGIQPDQELQDFIFFVFSDNKKELCTKCKELIKISGYYPFTIEDVQKNQLWYPTT